MQTFSRTIDGYNYTIICESKNTRNGFKHEAYLYQVVGIEMYLLNKATCHYINRTWEAYTYQTVISCVINELIDRELNEFIANAKEVHNIKRLTSAKRAELLAIFEASPSIKRYRGLWTAINSGRYNGGIE